MEVETSCYQCKLEGYEYKRFRICLPQQNDSIYTLSCPEGHEFKVTIVYHQFQKLFEIAIYALEDGYYREAIGSFAASMERFMELFIRIANVKSHLVKDESSCDFGEVWKKMRKYSERQYGAYLITYWKEFKKPPELVDETLTSLRNKVIHQGYIPTKEEVIKYGNKVMRCMISTLSEIGNYPELKDKLVFSLKCYSDEGIRKTLVPFHMIPTNSPVKYARASVEELLADISDRRKEI